MRESSESSPSLYGLLLCGGRSRRMGQDKATLATHGTTALARGVTLLSGVCETVFLSCREDQAKASPYNDFPQIHDEHPDTGPMGGIVSAMRAHPNHVWLVMACDMPQMDAKELRHLVAQRLGTTDVTAFQLSNRPHPEPLCAIYEPSAQSVLAHCVDEKRYALKHAFENLAIHAVAPLDAKHLMNVNSPEDLL